MDPIYEAYKNITEAKDYVYVGLSTDKKKQFGPLNKSRYSSVKKLLVAAGIKTSDMQQLGAHDWNSIFVYNTDLDKVKNALSGQTYTNDLDIRAIKGNELP